MPLKKSALLLILLGVGSVSLLVYASGITPAGAVTSVMPAQCPPIKCCNHIIESKLFSPWEMISQMMLRTAA